MWSMWIAEESRSQDQLWQTTNHPHVVILFLHKSTVQFFTPMTHLDYGCCSKMRASESEYYDLKNWPQTCHLVAHTLQVSPSVRRVDLKTTNSELLQWLEIWTSLFHACPPPSLSFTPAPHLPHPLLQSLKFCMSPMPSFANACHKSKCG